MELIQLTPRLYFIRLPVGHAYLWHDPGGLTLTTPACPAAALSLPAGTGQHARATPPPA